MSDFRIFGLLICFAIAGPTTAFAADAKSIAVEEIRNLSYYDGPDRDAYRHRLDIYLPKGVERFPVVVFVHGGGWSMGSKDGFLFVPGHKASDHGRFYARQGIAAVLISYRLSNNRQVRHPDHVTDVARAFAWVRRNLPKYGGDPDRIFVAGHSAGGHLAALLATDPKYLMAEGLTPSMIRGVIPISGVFSLSGELSLQTAPPTGGQATGPATFFTRVFGPDPAGHFNASPLTHVRPGLPPFLIATADRDLPTLPAQAGAFAEALKSKGSSVQRIEMKDRSHQSILHNLIRPEDPLGTAVIAFVLKKPKRK